MSVLRTTCPLVSGLPPPPTPKIKQKCSTYLPILKLICRCTANIESLKDGLTIKNDLKWNTHISNVCTNANRTTGYLKRNLYSCPPMWKKQHIKDWCGRSWKFEVQFGTLILMASRKHWKRSKIVLQGL